MFAAFTAILGTVQSSPFVKEDTSIAVLEDRARVTTVGTIGAVVGGIAASNILGQAFEGHGDLIAGAWAASIVDQLRPIGLRATDASWVPEFGQRGLVCWTVDAVFSFSGTEAAANALKFAKAADKLLNKKRDNDSTLYNIFVSGIDLPNNHTMFATAQDDDFESFGKESRNIGWCINPGFDFTHHQSNSALCLPERAVFPHTNRRKCQ